MDFFDQQVVARRRSGRLVVLFGLAVVAIVVVTYVGVSAGFVGTSSGPRGPAFFDPLRFVAVAVGIMSVIGLGSAYKISQLSGGGASVAELMGGRLLEPGSDDPLERRLLNVVEEMAIASGLPVPPVYLLDDERGINAFAAGAAPGDAVLGFTRGSIEKLSRSELQGVVGHEFSHVLNGDMRLNLRLIGVLHGILVIGLIGQYVFRSVAYAPRRSSKNAGSATAAALGAGLSLMLMGAIGTFFGKLIQAAVSREREYLADASAVQFTRDPSGIAGALKKIGGYQSGSKVRDKHASEVSHMLFEEHTKRSFTQMFATHPPLLDRIARLDPSFAGELEQREEPTEKDLKKARARAAEEEHQRRSGVTMGFAGSSASGTSVSGSDGLEHALDQAGQVDVRNAERVRSLLDRLPLEIVDGAGCPFDARAIVCGLLLSSQPEARARQITGLRGLPDATLADSVEQLAPVVAALPDEARLPVLDLCLRSLRELTAEQYRILCVAIDLLIDDDSRVDLHEACLRRIVRKHLDPLLEPGRRSSAAPQLSASAVSGRMAIVLSMLAKVGHTSRSEVEQAYAAAAEVLGLDHGLPGDENTARGFECALEALERAKPKVKRRFLKAAARAIESDGRVTVAEAELFRAVAESLGVPVPPALAAADTAG